VSPSVVVAPLTGVASTNLSIAGRPAVIVKIDDAPEARPQAGLDGADIVIEERVEGGVGRLMVIFQSQQPNTVGPVRSLRSTDPPVVRAIGGLFAYSGGIPPFVADLHASGGVVDVGANADSMAYYRRDDRPAPHNLYTSVATLSQAVPAGLAAPPPLLRYLIPGEVFGGSGVAPASHLTVAVGERSVADWEWDVSKRAWLRSTNGTPHTVESGGQLAFPNVIVQFVSYQRTPYTDPAHAPVDQANVLGTGDAWILASASVVRGRWAKASPTDVTAFTDDTGEQVRLPAGPTWIMLAPAGAAASVS
jgi:hypothetical protein